MTFKFFKEPYYWCLLVKELNNVSEMPIRIPRIKEYSSNINHSVTSSRYSFIYFKVYVIHYPRY